MRAPDQPSEEAVEAAAKADYEHFIVRDWTGASDFDQITWLGRMRAVLAAAYPHLRQQIETEVREQIAQEIRASGVAQITFLDGDTSRLGIHRRVGAEDAYNDCYRIVTAVGAAQSGGK